MSTATLDPALDGPLTQEQRYELVLCQRAGKADPQSGRRGRVQRVGDRHLCRRCPRPFTLSVSALPVFLVTAGLSVIAYNEFQGRKRLLRFDPSRPCNARLEPDWPDDVDRRVLPVDAFRGPCDAGPLAADMRIIPSLPTPLARYNQVDHLYRFLVVADLWNGYGGQRDLPGPERVVLLLSPQARRTPTCKRLPRGCSTSAHDGQRDERRQPREAVCRRALIRKGLADNRRR